MLHIAALVLVGNLAGFMADPLGEPDFVAGQRWPGNMGDPIVLTWSLVPDGLEVDGKSSRLFQTLDTQFGGREIWTTAIESCFARWDDLSGVRFERVRYNGQDWDDGAAWGTAGAEAKRGDLRVAMAFIDGPGNVAAYTYAPGESGIAGETLLDAAENWADPNANYRWLRNHLAHEIGVALGLKTTCPTKGLWLMERFVPVEFDTVQHDDIRGIQSMYGDIYERNDSSGQATSLGAFEWGQVRTVGQVPPPSLPNGSTVSVQADGGLDWYRFDVSRVSEATVVLEPVGLLYETSHDACKTIEWFDSRAAANLAVQVIGRDGQRVIATADREPAGQPERLVRVALDEGAGAYYLRIYETAAQPSPQLYALRLHVTAPQAGEGDLNCDGAVNFGDINPFALALADPDQYQREYPGCRLENGDLNHDGKVDFGDINPFVELLGGN